jgi:hypothetical protein
MTDNPTTVKLLQEMASLTALSGRISDLQAHNLKIWPLVYFEGVTEIKVDYDLKPEKSMSDEPTFSNSRISYYLTIDESKNTDLEKRYMALEKSVRSLFWSDVVLEIYFNNKITYKSTKNG